DDSRMIELGKRAGLAGEPFGEGRVVAVRQHLQCDHAVQSRLPGLVDRSHAACAEQFDNFQLWENGRDLGNARRRERRVIAGLTRVVQATDEQALGAQSARSVSWEGGTAGW